MKDREPRSRSAGVGVALGAALALGGASIVRARPLSGHSLILAGVVAFALGARALGSGGREPPAAGGFGGTRFTLVGFLLCALATGARMLGLGDGLVLGLWLAGLFVTSAGASAAHVRSGNGPRATDGAALLFVFAAAAVASFTRLADFPPAVHGDVGEIALQALAMNVPRDIFRPSGWWSIPGLHHAIQRAGLWINDGLVGARAPDAAMGVAAALVLYAIVRRLVDRRSAVVTALLAVGSAALLNTWRSGLGLGPPPLLALAAFWAFLRGAEERDRPRDFFLLAGLVAGLSLQVNLAARVVPVSLAALAAHEALVGSPAERRRIVRGFAWTVAAAFAVAGPLLWFYVRDPALLLPHSDKTVLSAAGLAHSRQIYGVASLADVLWVQALRSLGMFHYYGNAEAGFFVIDGPFFEPPMAALVLLGAGAAAFRLRERRFAWPLIAGLVSLSLEALTINAPSYHRAGPAAAMAVLLAGSACGVLLRGVDTLAARAATVTAALLAIGGVASGASLYFFDHCRQRSMFSVSTTVALRMAEEPVEGSFTYLMAGFPIGYGNIRFVARGRRGTDLPPGAPRPELAPGVSLFIAEPVRAAELRELAGSLPPGRWEKLETSGDDPKVEILVLRVEVPPPAS